MKAKITSVGHYIPKNVISNTFLSEKFGIEEERIFERTGILERRYVSEEETTTSIACLAIKSTIEKSPIQIEDIDCIIVSNLAPDYFFPSTAVAVIHQLGASKAWGFDLAASCSGFCFALCIAQDMVEPKTLSCVVQRG
jgi:3-oxoacyl-[acyl-carrier-protein] synthase III